jgi:hypothetical protein
MPFHPALSSIIVISDIRDREFILILFRIDPGQRPGDDGSIVILSQWRSICAPVEPHYHKTQSGLSFTSLVFL